MIRALLCHSNCQTPEPSQYIVIVRFVIINIYIFSTYNVVFVIHDNFRIYHPGSQISS